MSYSLLSFFGASFLVLASANIWAIPMKKIASPKNAQTIKPKSPLAKPLKSDNVAQANQNKSKTPPNQQNKRKNAYKFILDTFAEQLARAPQEVDKMLASLYACLSGKIKKQVEEHLSAAGRAIPVVAPLQARCPLCPPVKIQECPQVKMPLCAACPPVEAPTCPSCPEAQYIEVTRTPETYQNLYTAFDVYINAKRLLQERYSSYINAVIYNGGINTGYLAQELYASALTYSQALNQINAAYKAVNPTGQLLQTDNLYSVLVRGVLRSYNLELPV